MKAILEFNLEDPEDTLAYAKCLKASDMASFIWELQHNFWRKWKHDETDFTLDRYKEALWDLMEEHNLNTDEL
jgi:murein L,D-transpeptidase YafK